MPLSKPFDATSFSARLLAELEPFRSPGRVEPLKGSGLAWREWLRRYYAHVCLCPFAERHIRLWEWFESLQPGERPRPRVEVWPRGGAKSSTGELGCVRVGAKLSRRFVLYVSETQEQADKHVQSIASLFEAVGVERALNKYGTAKGWRRDQLRTQNGFNVSAYGLDVACRGVKLDQYRPDLILFDDVDTQSDSVRSTEKKIEAITTAILPAGSSDCAVLFLQNLIREEGIVAQLVDGRADFLRDREVPPPEPAVRGLSVETEESEGVSRYRILGGEATWEGQSLDICERQINDWGLRAFLREAQHEVRAAEGYFFNVEKLRYIRAEDTPRLIRKCRAWDFAGTEGGGDKTAGILIGRSDEGRIVIADARIGQWGSDRVRREVLSAAPEDGRATVIRLPQDPGQAGKEQAEQYKRLLAGYPVIVRPVTGKKWTRAAGLADAINRGSVDVVIAPWNWTVVDELRRFREDELDQDDDIVDAASDAFNEIAKPSPGGSVGGGRRALLDEFGRSRR